MSQTFENFKEFKEKYPKKAEQLLCDVEEGEWQNEPLEYYDSLTEYAQYELEDGWYMDLGLCSCTDFHGAPNPIDYIDLEGFGNALVRSWDESCHYLFSDDSIVTTSYGW